MGEESFVGASLMKVYIGADCTRSKGSLLKVFTPKSSALKNLNPFN